MLDLGRVTSTNVEFFNRRRAKLAVFDLERTLKDEGLWEPPAKLPLWQARASATLTLADEQRFDLVLAWDLVNYLGRERWPVVARLLVDHLAAGGAVHLLVRSGREMPARPGLFRVGAVDTLLEESRSTDLAPSPRFSHAEVERLHPGLAAVRSFLDKHGVQEFLLEHAEELHLPPRAVAKPRVRRS